ncbi:MAG: HAD family hydrolase [Clostridia bacterium]|nr:HAD family hydrolase [Clostridia bacterium]MBQ7137765.1 HAD family hydrolase [Clostridia bacterium]
MKKPVIFFDWDGTLCDSMQLCIEENRSTLRLLGLPDQPDEVLRRCNGPTFEEAAPIIGVPEERMEEYCRIRLSCALALVEKVNRLFPGARELLSVLKNKAELCIVSNGTQAYLTRCMQHFGLEGVFHRIVWSHPERTKTQNLAGLMAELQPERAVMVGDRIGDIRAGRENGLTTIAAAFGYGNDAEYAEADLRADSMAQLQETLLHFCRD